MKGILYNPKRPVTKATVYQLAYDMHCLSMQWIEGHKELVSQDEKLKMVFSFIDGENDAYNFCMIHLFHLQGPSVVGEFLELLQGWIEFYCSKQKEIEIKDEKVKMFNAGYENGLRHIRDFVSTGLDNCFPAYGGDVCTKR